MNCLDFEVRGFKVKVVRRSDVEKIRKPISAERLKAF